jgi:hypothetical protein
MLTRRDLVRAGGAAGCAALLPRLARRAPLPPLRPLTHGPGHHWFGYYDKLQFGPGDEACLGMRVEFEHRTPRPDDRVAIGAVTRDGWTELGSSTAWGWQQGCMLQWRPGDSYEIVWNDRADDRYVARVLDTRTRATRELPRPVYALAPNGAWALSADFARIQALRPGYGYVGLPDPYAAELAPERSGVERLDLESGAHELVVSIAELAALAPREASMDGARHYVNHLLVAPGSERIVFLHRWRPNGGRDGFRTRMITAGPRGEDRYVLDPSGRTSHFIWKDDEHILAWTEPAGEPPGYYLFRDRAREVTPVGRGMLHFNGHVTYVPGHPDWLLTDTYPDRARREQHPLLFHEPTETLVALGHFHSPPEYAGEWRCDTHPRSSRDGRRVVIDSPHGGGGRQMWEIDVSRILASRAR